MCVEDGYIQEEEEKKKQVPHPPALRAYGLRMTTKGKGIATPGVEIGDFKSPPLRNEGSGTRKTNC